jgi:hypothetical protein
MVEGRVRDGWVGFRDDAEVDVILQAIPSQLRYVNRAECLSNLLFPNVLVNNIRLDSGFLKGFSRANPLTQISKEDLVDYDQHTDNMSS